MGDLLGFGNTAEWLDRGEVLPGYWATMGGVRTEPGQTALTRTD
ncbi:hypothetical protein ACFY8B_33095 [Streptomyces sp. NPDC012751]